MDKRVVLDIVARDWLDVRCLTRLLLTGDKSLKTLLVQNVRILSQYYHADPRVFVWVWPHLALRTFVNATSVTLVTPFYVVPDDAVSSHRRPLIGQDFDDLPSNVMRLKVWCGQADLSTANAQVMLLHEKLTYVNVDHVSDAGHETIQMFPTVTKNGKLVSCTVYDWTVNGKLVDCAQDWIANSTTIEKLSLAGFSYGKNIFNQMFASSSFINLTALHLSKLGRGIVDFDIALLPLTLRKLILIGATLKNSHALYRVPLIELKILHCSWVVSTPMADTTIVCPLSLTDLHVRNNRSQPLNDHKNTYIIPAELNTLEISLYSGRVKVADNQKMTGLASLTSTFYDDVQMVNDVMEILSSASNLRELNVNYEGTTPLYLSMVISLCPHLASLRYKCVLTLAIGPPDWMYHPSPNLVKCLVPHLIYSQQISMISSCVNLQELSMTVKLDQLQELNCELKPISSLKILKLGIYLSRIPSYPSNEYQVIIPALPSLLSLSLYPVEENYYGGCKLHFSFAGTAEQPLGAPPMLEILSLEHSPLGSYFILSSEQIDQLPASLEYLSAGTRCKQQLTSRQRARLHNLIW